MSVDLTLEFGFKFCSTTSGFCFEQSSIKSDLAIMLSQFGSQRGGDLRPFETQKTEHFCYKDHFPSSFFQ